MKNGCARPQSVPMTTFINLSPKSETEFVIKSEPCGIDSIKWAENCHFADEEMHIIELAMQLERNVEHKKDKPPGEVDEVQLWSQHLFNNMGINNGQNMIIQRSPVSVFLLDNIYLYAHQKVKINIFIQMNWRCETILTTTDMYYAWYRAYVLLADWAHSIPEFKQLSLSDQVRNNMLNAKKFRQRCSRRIFLHSGGWPMPTVLTNKVLEISVFPWGTAHIFLTNNMSKQWWMPRKKISK